jgi:anti-sigma B factor antagonist
MPENEFHYTVTSGEKEGTVIYTLEGPFTLANMFKIQGELRTAKPPCLIMDMAGVTFMDSAGLGVIMNCFVSSQAGGRKFYLSGVNERVKSLLEMTKVDSVLRMFPSIEAAQAQA